MIQMYHVDLRYAGGTYGLRDVSITLERGEFAFLTGASGAGKTSLLRLLFAAEQPSAGQILVAGRNITRIRAAQIPALRRQTGVIFQDFKLLPERTVFENVAIALEIAASSRSSPARAARARRRSCGCSSRPSSPAPGRSWSRAATSRASARSRSRRCAARPA